MLTLQKEVTAVASLNSLFKCRFGEEKNRRWFTDTYALLGESKRGSTVPLKLVFATRLHAGQHQTHFENALLLLFSGRHPHAQEGFVQA